MRFLTIGCKAPFRGTGFSLKQSLMPLKFTFVFLFTFLVRVNAREFSKKVTFSGKDVPLEKLFNVIEEQTGYVFFYDYQVIQHAKPVTIHARDLPLELFLNDCFRNQELEYVIEGKTILVKKKDPGLARRIRAESSAGCRERLRVE